MQNEIKNYSITGMTCSACSARVEKVVSNIDGIQACSVNLLTNSMQVKGDVDSATIIEAVEKAGYGASLKNKTEKNSKVSQDADSLKNKDIPVLVKRLIFSSVFLIALMYVSMGHSMWGWKIPFGLEKNLVAAGIVQLLLSSIILVINQKFFINGFLNLIKKAPNMDTLVALGSASSFGYSLYALFAMTNAVVQNQQDLIVHFYHEFYFESAAMIVTLITLGKLLEAISKGKTTSALKDLMKLAPKTATIIQNDKEISVPVEDVCIDDIFVVRPGEIVPVDGIIVEGISAINEAAVTGESIPADKSEGDKVISGTHNQSGFIKCKATKVGNDTTLQQIIQMVSDASASKAPIAKVADKVSGIFVPAVITIAIVTLISWLLVGQSAGFALARAISVLVISCPCALGLATPVAIMVANGVGAKKGILFKTAEALEETGKIQIVALDKTGTITNGVPKVVDIIPNENVSENELLQLALDLEAKSEHPLSKAIINFALEKNLVPQNVKEFVAVSGNGLQAKNENDELIFAGKLDFVQQNVKIPLEMIKTAEDLSLLGKTVLFFGMQNKFYGIIAVADTIRSDSAKAIEELKKLGITVIMLSGDNKKTAKVMADKAGVDKVIAGVLPDGKEKVIKDLQKYGKVCMVGDGINDAPALTTADIGIAIGAGTDIAIDAADVVLMNNNLLDVAKAIRLSRGTLKNITQNLFWAFIYNIIGIPLAAGIWIYAFGWKLNPMFGAAAMSFSSFCVVINALRLNLLNINSSKKDKKIKEINSIQLQIMEDESMEKSIKIEGMMCGHCSGRVKKCLEATAGIANADVSHETGIALVRMDFDVADEVLTKIIEDEGYKVLEIK